MISLRRITPLAPACLALVILSGMLQVAPAGAAELLPPRTADRKFPQSFCPLPVVLTFVADGPAAIVKFSTTTVNYLNGGTNTYSGQRLDNICVVPEAVYQAHKGPLGSRSNNCYTDVQLTETFYFDQAGTIPLKESFTTDPALSGWDMSSGASWDPARSAPNDPGTDAIDTPLGCLVLGQDVPPHALTDVASTSIAVNGLTAGTTYRLTADWAVEDMLEDKIQVTATVYGYDVVPAKRRTLGQLKKLFR